jgi:hypothetical protein
MNQTVMWHFFSLRETIARLTIAIIAIYLTWNLEYRGKKQFIQMAQISKMNEELYLILTKHMPDAIMLLGQNEKEP